TANQQGNSFQMDFAVRGFQGTSVTGAPRSISGFVDGVRVNEPTVEEINFDLLPLDDIERIELIRGPAAVFGRNTLGGALNIVTRRGTEVRENGTEGEWRSFGRQKYGLRVGGATGPFDYYVAGTYFTEDGWRDRSASRIGQLFTRFGFREGGTDLSLSYQRAQNRIEQPGSLPESEIDQHPRRNFTGGDFFEPLMNMVTLNAKQELGERWSLGATLFTRWLDAEQFNVNLIANNSRSFTSTATTGGTFELINQTTVFGRSSRLVLGVEGAYANAHVRVFEETPAGQREVNSDVRDAITTAGGSILNPLELGRDLLVGGDHLLVPAGSRFDVVRHNIGDRTPDPDIPSSAGKHTFTRATPRFGINYNPTSRLNFFFSFAEGFRAPAFLELTCASPATICPGLQAGARLAGDHLPGAAGGRRRRSAAQAGHRAQLRGRCARPAVVLARKPPRALSERRAGRHLLRGADGHRRPVLPERGRHAAPGHRGRAARQIRTAHRAMDQLRVHEGDVSGRGAARHLPGDGRLLHAAVHAARPQGQRAAVGASPSHQRRHRRAPHRLAHAVAERRLRQPAVATGR